MRSKKGFTITELIIVIVVIAILAAVLIPTFISLINKANLSADQQAVRQMNTILAAEEVTDKPATVTDAKDILIANGISDFVPTLTGNTFYWVGADNRVLLWTADEEDATKGAVTYPKESVEKYKDLTEPSADWHDLKLDYAVQTITIDAEESAIKALLDAVEEAADGSILRLPKNTDVDISQGGWYRLSDALKLDGGVGKTLTIDLNGNKLVSEGADAQYVKDAEGNIMTYVDSKGNEQKYLNLLLVPENASLTLMNGAIVSKGIPSPSKAIISIDTGACIVTRNVTIETDGTAFFPEGDACEVILDDCKIIAAGFGVATNKTSSTNIHIKVSDTKISQIAGSDGFTGVMINVPGLLEVDNSEITGDYQGIIVRGGTAVIADSVITHTEESWAAWGYTTDSHAAMGNKWLEGNNVNLAALTVGNRNNEYYPGPSKVTLINTKVIGSADWPAIYAYANSGDGNGVTITYDDASTITGVEMYGNSGANITVNGTPAN